MEKRSTKGIKEQRAKIILDYLHEQKQQGNVPHVHGLVYALDIPRSSVNRILDMLEKRGDVIIRADVSLLKVYLKGD